MFVKMALESGNGGFLGFFAFSACRLEMIFNSPVEIKEPAFFQCSASPPPTGAGLRWTSPAGPRP
jgi:hypothetical protein